MTADSAVTKSFNFGSPSDNEAERLKAELAASEKRLAEMRDAIENMYDRLARGEVVSFEVGAERAAITIVKPQRVRRKGGAK